MNLNSNWIESEFEFKLNRKWNWILIELKSNRFEIEDEVEIVFETNLELLIKYVLKGNRWNI